MLDIPASENFRPVPLSHALFNAATRGHVNVGKLLLERGALPEHADITRYSPLHAAAYRGYTEFVLLLLEYGANIESRQFHGITPLMLAAAGGSLETVQILLHAGKRFT